jgi:hypothetical protein
MREIGPRVLIIIAPGHSTGPVCGQSPPPLQGERLHHRSRRIINGLYASDSSTFSRRSRLRKTTVPTHPPVRLKDVLRQVQADHTNLRHGRLLSVVAYRHSGTPSPLQRRPPHQAGPEAAIRVGRQIILEGEVFRGLEPS